MKKKSTTYKKKYYDIKDDFREYPDAWMYMVWSKRGPGKTYSTLRYMIENNKIFVFVKRTIKEVNILCGGGRRKRSSASVDLSPFKPLNRDFGWNIYMTKIPDCEGLAAFFQYEMVEGELVPVKLVGYCIAVSAIIEYKGFDMSEADYLIFDEFIPRKGERLNRNEGDLVMDLYETVSRDRIKRGRPELILICLANAVNINNPMFQTMDVIDTAADMSVFHRWYTWLEERGILLHFIDYGFDLEEGAQETGAQKAMKGTQWAKMAYGGEFAYDDFSAIGKVKLKHHKCKYSIRYKEKLYWLYYNEETKMYFLCQIRGQTDQLFDLNRENQQKLFWQEKGIDLRQAAIEDRVIFSCYVAYDLIVNYKQIFKL